MPSEPHNEILCKLMVQPVSGKAARPLLLLHRAAAVPDRHGVESCQHKHSRALCCLLQDYDQYARGGFLSY